MDYLKERGIDLNVVPGPLRRVYPTGSRYICNPPVMDTDIDFVVLVESLTIYAQHLLDSGWNVTIDDENYGGNRTEQYSFITARKGIHNLIVYHDQEGFDLFWEATEEARQKNLLNKEDRVKLFEEKLSWKTPEFDPELPF